MERGRKCPFRGGFQYGMMLRMIDEVSGRCRPDLFEKSIFLRNSRLISSVNDGVSLGR